MFFPLPRERTRRTERGRPERDSESERLIARLFLGYVDAAVHLQKQWNVEDPQQLPFAPHVTSNHALVTIVNKGLLYNACERDAKLVRGILLFSIMITIIFITLSQSPSQSLSIPLMGIYYCYVRSTSDASLGLALGSFLSLPVSFGKPALLKC
jgi:hypothetical protein